MWQEILTLALFIASVHGKTFLIETAARRDAGPVRPPLIKYGRAKSLGRKAVMEHGVDYSNDIMEDTNSINKAVEYGDDYSEGADDKEDPAEFGRKIASKVGMKLEPEDMQILRLRNGGPEDMDITEVASFASRALPVAMKLKKENPTEFQQVADQVRKRLNLDVDGLIGLATEKDIENGVNEDMFKGRSTSGDYSSSYTPSLEDFADELAKEFGFHITQEDRELFKVYDPKVGVISLLPYFSQALDFARRLLPFATKLRVEDPERFDSIVEEFRKKYNIDIILMASMVGMFPSKYY